MNNSIRGIVIDPGHGGISLAQNVEWLWMLANTLIEIFLDIKRNLFYKLTKKVKKYDKI